MPGWKSALPLLGPALILLIAGVVWLMPHGESKPASGREETHTSRESWEAVDFQSLKAGDSIPAWEVVQGPFSLVQQNGRTVLELRPEPMGEGKLKWSQLMTGGGGVRARMQGERSRRSAPRFCVSLEGQSEIQLRAYPAKDVIEIAVPGIPEKVLASVPWKWQPERWLWLELHASPAGTAGTRFEGRVWPEGDPRPASPTISYDSPAPPGMLRAIVEGAPYALRPIYYDRIEALRFYR